MKLAVDTFRGEFPRTSPRLLPSNAAQQAMNCRMQTGDLESWRQFLLSKTLANIGTVQTIYLLNGVWLSWNAQVDVARGLIAGDASFRIYLTSPGLYATPRWTDYALATTGAEPFPVATRPLGVPGPAAAPSATSGAAVVPSISVIDLGNQLANWTTSGTLIAANVVNEVTQSAGVGNPAPSYYLRGRNNVAGGTHAYRDFGVGSAAVVTFNTKFTVRANGGPTINIGWRAACNAAGVGCSVKIGYTYGPAGGAQLLIGTASGWGNDPSPLESLTLPGMDGTGATWYSSRITVTRNANGSATVNAKILNGATVLGEVELTSGFTLGGYCGVESVAGQGSDPETGCDVDNIEVTGSGSIDAINTTATSYVYTFVNDVGEQSAPSPASATVLHPDGVAVTVTTPTTTPVVGDAAAYAITTKYIYRSVSGANGTAFIFVATIPLATADYVDSLSDAAIAGNDVLESDEWDPPPAELQGIIALPNGIMAGFYRNLLCLSAAGRPHAWPVRYRRAVDTDIVAIANIDNTIVIGTKSFLYTATGNSPDSYSMSKPGDPQACVSKRSMVFLPDVGGPGGVAYASPDGWIICAGSAGQVSNASNGIFTKRQWAALDPSSMIAAVHDGALFFFSTGQAPDAGYALDTKSDGFGLIQLSFHATALHVDPLTDALHMVLDLNNEPVDVALPVASTAVVPTGLKVFQFDAGASDMVYRWRGRLNLTPYPLTLTIAQVRAASFANLVLRLYGDGVEIHKRALVGNTEFALPATDTYDSLEIELMGTGTVRTLQAAEDVSDLS